MQGNVPFRLHSPENDTGTQNMHLLARNLSNLDNHAFHHIQTTERFHNRYTSLPRDIERGEKGKLVWIKSQQTMLVCVTVIVAPLNMHIVLLEVVSPVVVVSSSEPVMLLCTLLLWWALETVVVVVIVASR